MYFPFLRCKQFELLAIREIAPKLSNKKISFVLEPVKKSLDNLEKALNALIDQNINFTLILNPQYGELINEPGILTDFINSKLSGYANYQYGILINQFIDFDNIDRLLIGLPALVPITLIHQARSNDMEGLADLVSNSTVKYHLYGDNFPVRRYRGIIHPDRKVLLEDRFNSQAKNADYLHVPDELFSDDILYYAEEGFTGFGDYTTIGNDYLDSGFLPYAVAIHFTYQKKEGEIWIRHFVSDSNSNKTDPAGKFGEALEKLIIFINQNAIHTEAAEDFRKLHQQGHYPGLGTNKKLSIKHHLELINNILTAL